MDYEALLRKPAIGDVRRERGGPSWGEVFLNSLHESLAASAASETEQGSALFEAKSVYERRSARGEKRQEET